LFFPNAAKVPGAENPTTTPAECGFGSLAILAIPATQVLRIITRRPMVLHIITVTITTIPAVRIMVVSTGEDITAVDSTEAVVGIIDRNINRSPEKPRRSTL